MNYTPTRQEELAQLFSDLYKDVNGFRPRHCMDLSEASLEAEITKLEEELPKVIARERQAEDVAAAKFEQRLTNLISIGAGDRATALRWVHQAEGTNGDDEYLCWTLGLRYGYFK